MDHHFINCSYSLLVFTKKRLHEKKKETWKEFLFHQNLNFYVYNVRQYRVLSNQIDTSRKKVIVYIKYVW